MKGTILSILCTILICTIASSIVLAEDAADLPTIEVVGKARIMVMPNVATISFAVETNSPKARDAVGQNAEQTTRVLNALRRISGQKTKIRTSGFSLSPVYEEKRRLRPSGYRVRNTVVVETKNLDKVGSLIDEASNAGASGIGSLTFSTDKEESLRKDAAAEAVRDAMKSAENLAKAADLSIQRIIKISYAPRMPVLRSMVVAAAERVTTPIEIGQIPVEASVNVVFEAN
jgi:uncharacterized protein YggE